MKHSIHVGVREIKRLSKCAVIAVNIIGVAYLVIIVVASRNVDLKGFPFYRNAELIRGRILPSVCRSLASQQLRQH